MPTFDYEIVDDGSPFQVEPLSGPSLIQCGIEDGYVLVVAVAPDGAKTILFSHRVDDVRDGVLSVCMQPDGSLVIRYNGQVLSTLGRRFDP